MHGSPSSSTVQAGATVAGAPPFLDAEATRLPPAVRMCIGPGRGSANGTGHSRGTSRSVPPDSSCRISSAITGVMCRRHAATMTVVS